MGSVTPKVSLLDTTLREGEQTPGVYFDVHIKVAIADLLNEIGLDIIEAGHPAVTDEIQHAVEEIAGRNLHARVGAHARSLKADVDLALECGVQFLGIFYCVAEERLTHHSKGLTQAVEQISQVISYAKALKPDLVVRYTPEDAVRSSFENVIFAASEAAHAGADVISIADTTGFMIPGTKHNLYDYVSRLKDELAKRSLSPRIAVHCHNDRGLALANALDGYRAGAEIIDASVMGLGERAGIVDLAILLAVLVNDFNARDDLRLNKLPELYHLVSKYSGLPIPVNFPVIGENAFTHCAGVHTQAALKNPLHYQSLDPSIVGRKSKIALDHMSGLSAVRYSLDQIGEENTDRAFALRILEKVKEVGQRGRTVDLTELKYIVRYLSEQS
ncbi:2-isopropylmalate synthase [candidate division KSB1 bacterium]|nr:2-isopropylmalate synthase [candidate division KSB1 bacterium]